MLLPQNLNQTIALLKRKIQEEAALMEQKKTALAQNDADINKLNEEIRQHEQEIKTRQAEIMRLQQEITHEKQEVSADQRKKPTLQQAVTHLANEKAVQERELTNVEHSFRDSNNRSANNKPTPRPII